jgi:hypothetical protein
MTNNLIILKSEDFVPNLLDFIQGSAEKICLVTMSRSYEFLKSRMLERGAGNANMFFIDCISKSLFMGIKDTPDCSFISIHMYMKDFSCELQEKLKSRTDCKVFIFDSLSDLKKYWPSGAESLSDFVNSLLPALSGTEMDFYFILYEKDKESCTAEFKAVFDGIYSSLTKDKESKG